MAARNDRHFAFSAGCLVLLTLACASYQDGQFEVTSGRFFDYHYVPRIQDHQTLEEELLQWLGPPLETTTAADGTKTLRYFAVRERQNIESRLFSRHVYTQTVEHELVVKVSGGLITAHDYKSRTQESER